MSFKSDGDVCLVRKTLSPVYFLKSLSISGLSLCSSCHTGKVKADVLNENFYDVIFYNYGIFGLSLVS